ncbi:MAG: ABC transporter permease subunit [Halobacteriaceae archaeon]
MKRALWRVGHAAMTVLAAMTLGFFGIQADLRKRIDIAIGIPSYRAREMAPRLGFDPRGGMVNDYVEFVQNFLTGSIVVHIPVNDGFTRPMGFVFTEYLPWTMLLLAGSMFTAVAIGIMAGMVMAYYERTPVDWVLSAAFIFLRSIPAYSLALLLLFWLYYDWDIFPKSGGLYAPGTHPGLNWPWIEGVLLHASLPIVVLVISTITGALAMRANCVRVLGRPFVRVARIRGLGAGRIATSYIGRNAILPLYTTLLVAVGTQVSMIIIVERLFRYPGLAQLLFASNDATLNAVILTLLVALVATGALIADLTYGYIDPRAGRHEGAPSGGLTAWLQSQIHRLRRLTTTGGTPDVLPDDTRSLAAVADTAVEFSDDDVGPTGVRAWISIHLLTPFRVVWDDRRGKIGLVVVGIYVVVALLGITVVDYPRFPSGPDTLPPFIDWTFPLGTNWLGQSLLTLIVVGTPQAFKMIIGGALLSTVVATVVGLFAGLLGGKVETALMTLADVSIAIPGIAVVALPLAMLGSPNLKDPWTLGLVLSIAYWGGTAREIRAQVTTLRQTNYVEAARTIGLPTHRIVVKDLLPHLFPYAFTKFVTTARHVLQIGIAFWFLGVLELRGARITAVSQFNWGTIMYRSERWGYALVNPQTYYWWIVPTGALVGLLFGLLLLAQATDRLGNPKIHARHAPHVDAETLRAEEAEADEETTGGRTGP